MKIEYVYQDNLNGSGGALLQAGCKLATDNKPFLVLVADDIYCQQDLVNIVKHKLAYGVAWSKPIKSGKVSVIVDRNGFYKGRKMPPPDEMCYIGVGAFILTKSIFEIDLVKLSNGELSIPHSLDRLDKPVKVVIFKNWHPVNTKKELMEAQEKLI